MYNPKSSCLRSSQSHWRLALAPLRHGHLGAMDVSMLVMVHRVLLELWYLRDGSEDRWRHSGQNRLAHHATLRIQLKEDNHTLAQDVNSQLPRLVRIIMHEPRLSLQSRSHIRIK